MESEKNIGLAWFHEHGHLIDALTGYMSHESAFYEALNADYIDLMSKFTESDIEQMIKYDYDEYSSVSDLLHGLSNKKIIGWPFHPKRLNGDSYWKENKIQEEAAAHMFECQFSSTRRKIMLSFFPRALRYYEDKLKSLL